MTLVVAVSGPKSIWLLTDRRLSLDRRVSRDDARKVLLLETTDGRALLGYAGLGTTALGTEPGDWMGRVLRGRNLPLEKCLGVLTDAIQRRLPPHLESLSGQYARSHHVLVTAFLGEDPKLYSIDLVRPRGDTRYGFRWTRYVTARGTDFGRDGPRVLVGGSGVAALIRDRSPWARELARIVKAHDRGRVSARAVASHLAKMNHRVHLEMEKIDRSVGSRCIVAWRFHNGGGAQEFFDGLSRDANPAARLPTIATGMDINDIVEVMMPYAMKQFEAMKKGESSTMDMDKDAINAELARLPDEPDETMD